MRLLRIVSASIAALCVLVIGVFSVAMEKPVVGWVERVRIYPGDFEIHAKIDTGAKTSSLNAPNLKIFSRDGVEWASFEVTNRAGRTQKFEEKIFRVSKIRRHGGRFQRRPVVMLGVCVGSVFQETQVNLIDRKNFNYQMLIGRRFMKGNVVVDPGRTFIARPKCNREAKK
jgi:hypothetical protein